MAGEKKNRGGTLNVLLILVMLVCLCVGGYSLYRIISLKSEDRRGEDTYQEVASKASGENLRGGTVTLQKDDQEETETLVLQDIDFEALWEINKDVIAWIELPGTIINYPIVQGEDNEQYLRHLLDGSYHRFGTLFIDYRNAPDFTNDNTIVYGHHIKAGDMFCLLEEYREQSYYDEHPYFLLYTPEKTYCLELFAGNLVNGNNPIPLIFKSKEEHQTYIDELYQTSTFVSPVKMTTEDRMVTLYTCAYDFDDAKYVLRGKLTEITE